MRRRTVSATLACLLTISIFSGAHFGGSHAYASITSPQADGPTLVIPDDLVATAPGSVTVPIHFSHNNYGVASTVFSLDYDPVCLALDTPAGQLPSDLVVFNLGPQFSVSASVNPSDTDGEVDIVIGDFSLPFSTLPNRDNLIQLTFNVVCEPSTGETINSPISFSSHPPPSFSNTLGYPIAGASVGGSVAIQRAQPEPTPNVTPQPGTTPAPSNTPPMAADDVAVTRIDQGIAIDVLANDTDIDGDSLSVREVTQGGFGQVAINAMGSIIYTPESGRSGEDFFTYIVGDGRGGLAMATVLVTVGDANKSPVAVNDNATTVENTSVSIDVLANDFDADPLSEGTQVTVVVVGQPGHGSSTLNQDSSVTYTPRTAYVGEDTFLYAIVDEEGASAIATVTVTVEPSDEPHGSTITEVDLADFTMGTGSGGNVAKWTTRAEGDILTFQVHRTAGPQVHEGIMNLPYTGAWTQVSPLIDGQGRTGAVYSFVDETALAGVAYAYVLAALGEDNQLTLYGPQIIVTGSSGQPHRIMLPLIATR